MEITKDIVNQWLDSHRERDRKWLAEKCGVQLSAVGNWLNTKGEARKIPAEHQITIRRLMDEDKAREESRPPQFLQIDFTNEEYEVIERAALLKPESMREWARRTLNNAAEIDVSRFLDEHNIRKVADDGSITNLQVRKEGPSNVTYRPNRNNKPHLPDKQEEA